MKPPRLYEEWCAVLEAFHSPESDSAVYAAILDGGYPQSAGITERTTSRLLSAYDSRLTQLQKALQNELKRSRVNVEVERALGDLVSGLKPLARLALLETFPVAIRKHLRDMLDTFTARIRESLEESARRSGSVDGVLLSSIKRVDIAVPWANAGTRLPPSSQIDPFSKRPRRLIL